MDQGDKGVSAADYLDEVIAEHRNARDSGEDLLDALVRLLKRNRQANLPAIRDQLIDWVATMDRKRWGIALEALTRDADPRNAVELEALLRNGRSEHDWREDLILALLRLRHQGGRDLYREHIIKSLDRPRPTTLTLLQHLYALDFGCALDWSARLFAQLISCRTPLGMTVVGHLISLCAISPASVIDLVERTGSHQKAAGDELRKHFLVELMRPWVRERLGPQTADALRSQLVVGSRGVSGE